MQHIDKKNSSQQESLENIRSQLLPITLKFLMEQSKDRRIPPLSAKASLERQLGIDSLGKVELFRRIEKKFGVRLPDQVMAESDSLEEIAQAILKATPATTSFHQPLPEFSLAGIEVDLSKVETLQEVLLQYAHKSSERPHIYLRDELGHEEIISYGQLFDQACCVANSLIHFGIKPDETIAIMLPTGREFFYSFFGVLLTGAVPVPIYPPFRADRIEEYAIRETKILNNAQVRILITFTRAEILSKILQAAVPSLKRVINAEILLSNNHIPPKIHRSSDQLALLQYTSGSTGDPKGILLQHKNILANMKGVQKAIELSPSDRVVSWLPLYHDMGLMSWLNSLYFGIPITILSPLTFINHPEQWLWAIHYHQATLSAGPNFAYELCVKKIDEEMISGLDLSSWRLAFNGAEAVNPKTLKRFYHKFKHYGFKEETLFPVYGLAENTVALAFPPLHRKPRIDCIEREAFEKKQTAISTQKKECLEFVSVGKCISNHKIRIVNDQGETLLERQVGNIQFQGPSSMQGYHYNPRATEAIYHEGWWSTGDLGYIADEELFITGRKKDLIIKAGRNLYPEFIEEVVGNIPGVRKGCVIAFGVTDPDTGTEKMIIAAETKFTTKEDQKNLGNELIEKVSIAIGVPPDQVILLSPHSIPKTSSGKLQRLACKQAYLKGLLTQKNKTFQWQIIKLLAKAVGSRILRGLNQLGRFAYTLYTWLMVIVTVIPVWLAILVIPRKKAAYLVKAWAKVLFKLVWSPIQVVNLQEKEIQQPVVYVANHASYADSIALLSVLPAGTLFVAKKELLKVPIISSIIKKLQFMTIDRWDFLQNIEDTENMKTLLRQGESLLIFPEGTFTYASGVRPFKTGAFQLAVDTQALICPIAIRNSRKFLRGNSYLFSRTSITLTLCPSIYPQGSDWHSITQLRNETLSVIVKYCGEPEIASTSSLEF